MCSSDLKVRRRIRMVREDSRARHLFNRADVQAMPWHEQGGKALALGTIIDAHDLRVYGESHGLYETMSGRFGGAITGDYEFPETGVSPNLTGNIYGKLRMLQRRTLGVIKVQ